MSQLPGYSAVIPAWNAANFILDALRSIAAQTHPPSEIIIVDDGSDDDLAAVLAQSLVGPKLIRQANHGPGAATTTGLAACRYDFIATLDADDIWLPQKIDRQLRLLVDQPDLDIIFARSETFGALGPKASVETEVTGWSRSTMLIRRSAFQKIGPVVDMPGRRGEMVDWLARAREIGVAMHMIEDILAQRRIHSASLSFGRNPVLDAGYLSAIKRALERRRAGGE